MIIPRDGRRSPRPVSPVPPAGAQAPVAVPEQQPSPPCKRWSWGLRAAWVAALALAGLAFAGPTGAADRPPPAAKSSCVDCHSNPKWLVQNKKLYDYFKAWKLSIHQQENVTCVDCHGGNPKTADKQAAHGDIALGAAQASSPINYQNVPATCARCHEEVYRNFKQSAHFQHLAVADKEQQGPTCVTCHGSVNTSVLNINNVRAACSRCHNKETENHPDIPARAEDVLSQFLSIHRYYRYIATQGDPKQIKDAFKVIDPRIKRLNASWHTFDLDKVGEETAELLGVLKQQRDRIQQTRPAPKPAP